MRGPTAIAISATAFLCLAGCDKAPAPVPAPSQKQMGNRSTKPKADSEGGWAAPAAPDPDYKLGISPDELSDELNTLLKDTLADAEDANAEFEKVLAALVEADPDLAAALKEPLKTPLFDKNNDALGPTIQELFEGYGPVYNALLEDYLANTKDSESVKAEVSELHNALQSQPPTNARLAAHRKLLKNGSADPLIIFNMLRFPQLENVEVLETQERMVKAIQSRACSDLTKFMCASRLVGQNERLPAADRTEATKLLNETTTKVWKQFGDQEPLQPLLMSATKKAMVVMRSKDAVAFAAHLLNEDRANYPTAFPHLVASFVHNLVAVRVRGTKFYEDTPEGKMHAFGVRSGRQMLHLLKAWSLEPDNYFVVTELLHTEKNSRVTPLTSKQWYRLAVTSCSDSGEFAQYLSGALQPKMRGSREELGWFAKQLADFAAANPRHALLVRHPVEVLVAEESFSLNIAEWSNLEELFAEVTETLRAANPDTPDARVSKQDAALIYRVLWDAHDLERLAWFSKTYESVFEPDTMFDYKVPFHLAEATLDGYRGEASDAWKTLQTHLLCGDESFDDAEFRKLDAALEEATKAAGSPTEALFDLKDGVKRRSTEPGDMSPSQMLAVCRRLLKLAKDYQAGESVELIANGPVGWSHTGETSVTYKKDSIDFTANGMSHTLLFSQPLRFELPLVAEAVVFPTMGYDNGDPYGLALYAGPIAHGGTTGTTSGRVVRYTGGPVQYNQPILITHPLPHQYGTDGFFQAGIQPINQVNLKLEIWKDKSASYVNDAMLSEAFTPMKTNGLVMIGRAANGDYKAATNKRAMYSVKVLRIKKLDPKKKPVSL